MAEKKELNPSPKFPSGDYPELSPNPNQREGLVNKTGEQPNTQFVNPERKQEKRCLTVSEVIELIKKIAPQYGAENVKFTVDNIKSLTDAQCEDLKVGDMVAKKTGNQNHVYVVTYKEKNQGLCLTYADASVVETQSYDYTEGHWVYNSEDKTELGEVDPSSLYGKFVRIMNAPSSTTLTDEQINIIKEGVFINGDFLGYKNPILLPFNLVNDDYCGLILGAVSGRYGIISQYVIRTATKIISEINFAKIEFNGGNAEIRYFNIGANCSIKNKLIPDFPANTGTFTLKCVDGVLTWVQDV